MSKVTWDFGEWSGAAKLWFYKKVIENYSKVIKIVDTESVLAKKLDKNSVYALSIDIKSVDTKILNARK